jgi:hypothetical protein
MQKVDSSNILCGPYEVQKADLIKTFCITTDNKVSVRTYEGGAVTKNNVLDCKDLEDAFKSLEARHLRKLTKGYKPAGKFSTYRGSAPAAPHVATTAKSSVKV